MSKIEEARVKLAAAALTALIQADGGCLSVNAENIAMKAVELGDAVLVRLMRTKVVKP